MKPYRCVLVGLGRMGLNHYRTIQSDMNFQLHSVVDPVASLPPAEEGQRPTPRLLRDLGDVPWKSVDCAIVASATETHYDIVNQLLDHKIPTLVEKPAATTPEQCEALVAKAATLRVPLAVGHVERCNPVVSALREVMQSQVVGLPVHLNATRAGAYPAHVREGNNVLLDLAVHDLDLMQMILGPLQVIQAQAHAAVRADTLDTAEISLRNQDSITATVHVNWLSPHRLRSLRVIGTRGVVETNFLEQSCQLFGTDLKLEALRRRHPLSPLDDQGAAFEVEIDASAPRPLSRQLNEFRALLQGEDHILATGEQLIDSVRLVAEVQDRFPIVPPLHPQESVDPWQPYFARREASLLN